MREMARNSARTGRIATRERGPVPVASSRNLVSAMSRHREHTPSPGALHDGHVLRDADQSLASWLGRLLPPGIGLRFEPPDPAWQTRPPEPLFVDAFLHSIRQDARGRQSGWADQRDADGRVIGRQPAAQYYRLSYLITVWAAGGGGAAERVVAEHEVLGLLLNACAHQTVLPADCLVGTLADSGLATVLECAPEDSAAGAGVGAGAGIAALWTGLGIAPHAHLELVLIAPARPPVLTELAPPVREIVLNAAADPGGPASSSRTAGASRTTSSSQAAGQADAGTAGQAEGRTARRTSSGTAGQPQPAPRPLSTLRRWEKQTIHELPPS